MNFAKRWSYDRKLKTRLASKSKNRSQSGKTSNKYIGIISDGKESADFDFLKAQIYKWQEEGKIVKSINYTEEPVNNPHFIIKNIAKKDLSWDLVPECGKTQEFLTRSYNSLFIAVRNYNPTLHYLARCAQADLKIGSHHEALVEYLQLSIYTVAESKISDIFDQFLKHLKVLHFE